MWDAITKAVGRAVKSKALKMLEKDPKFRKLTKDLEKTRKEVDAWTKKYRKQRGKKFHVPDEFKRMGIK